jgi:hypothetical protein
MSRGIKPLAQKPGERLCTLPSNFRLGGRAAMADALFSVCLCLPSSRYSRSLIPRGVK